jgi:hypothetical protein
MSQKIEIRNILKFNGSYFHIWKHKLNFLILNEKLWTLVEGIETKPIPPIAIQKTIRVQPLPYIGVGNIFHWEERDSLSFTIINNIIDNFVVSHI